MANIGSFKKSGQELQGEIVTLSLQTRGVRIGRAASLTSQALPSMATTPATPCSAAWWSEVCTTS